MNLDNLGMGQLVLLGLVPMILGLVIGLIITIVRYNKLKHSPFIRSYSWEIASDGAFTTGIIISHSITFIGLFIMAIVYNWNTLV